jgi:hypothetical protein
MTHNPNTTLIKVHPQEKPAVEKICHYIGIHVRCYSINEDVIIAEILTDDCTMVSRMYRLVAVEMENIKASMPTLAL